MQPKATEIKAFFYSQAFADGFRAAFAILTPAIAGYQFNFFQQGLAVSLGAMCTSLPDAPGPIRHRRNGMLAAGITAFAMAMVTGFARLNQVTLGIEIVMACFFFSMFNVFGTRATSVGNCGMMMMILTMDVNLLPMQVLPHALLVLAGAGFYSVLSLGLYALRPYRTAQRALGDCVQEIAAYLAIRGDFYDPLLPVDENYRKVVKQQIVVHEKQEAVRELLFKTRQIVEETTREGRRLVFYFVETVDLFERITAASFDYDQLRTRLHDTGLLPLLHNTIRQAANELDQIGKAMVSGTRYDHRSTTDELFQHLREAVDRVAARGTPALMLGRLLVNIRQLLHDIDKISGYFRAELPQRQNRLDSSRFVTVHSYHPAQLWTNIHFHSTVFRHAVRVATACAAGFAVSKLMGYGHHSYWILLTIAFILKPAFSLTKERNIQRIIGTIGGGLIGLAILFLTPDRTVHFIFLVLFMVGTYSFMRMNYLAMVICTTPYVLILFSFLGGEYKSVLEERLLDTVIGCAIAFSASYLLLPTWEAQQLQKDMRAMLLANAAYLQQLLNALKGQAPNPLEFKLARKNVYVALANLSATFQRMLSEPKSKQHSQKNIHQFVVLNHLLLSNIADLYANRAGRPAAGADVELVRVGTQSVIRLQEAAARLENEEATKAARSPAPAPAVSSQKRTGSMEHQQMEFIADVSRELSKISAGFNG